MGRHPELPRRVAKLLEWQRGRCPACGLVFSVDVPPELDLQEARIDQVTAELITLAEVDRRQGGQHPGGFGPGRDQQTPVWWVHVTGYFRYVGMHPAGQRSSPLYETNDRIFIYDARTG